MNNIAWMVSSMGQLAVLLEASSPKPGNVSRRRKFSDTDYRHFLASAALLGKTLWSCAETGIRLSENELTVNELHVGELILQGVRTVIGGVNKKNTLLGTIILYIPISIACAAMLNRDKRFDVSNIRRWVNEIIDGTDFEDTIALYRAFHVVGRIGGTTARKTDAWTEWHARYDIENPKVFDHIRKDQLALRDLFRLSGNIDTIAHEWSVNYSTVLEEILPYLQAYCTGLDDAEEAVVRTFVWLLSRRPDGLIVKKAGMEWAKRVQAHAQRVVQNEFDKNTMDDLDRLLTREGNRLNPGSTADLVSAGMFCRLVEISSSSQ